MAKSNSSSMDGVYRFLGAAIGAGIAETATLPVDIAKVRLQTQVANAKGVKPYSNFLQAGYAVVANEGVAALWKGLTPALVRQCSYTGLSFLTYEPIRNFIAGVKPGDDVSQIPAWKRVLAGGVAGGSSIIVVNPADVIKTQMQASASGTTMAAAFRETYRLKGIRGFWFGVSPNVGRCFVGNACEIGCYDWFKTTIKQNQLLPDGPMTHFGASGGAGIVSAVFSTPLDVAKTRLMNQAGVAGARQYKGMLDAFVCIPREEGILALYQGFAPLAVRKIAWTVIYFLAYEQLLLKFRGEEMQ